MQNFNFHSNNEQKNMVYTVHKQTRVRNATLERTRIENS